MADELRVAIFTDSFRPAVDGVTVYIENTARELSRRGIEVTVVTSTGRKYEEINTDGYRTIGVKGIKFPPYPQYRIATMFFKANKKLLNEGYNIIHTQTPFTVGFAGFLMSRHIESRLISTFHSMVFDETVISSYSRSNTILSKLLSRTIKRYLKWYYEKHEFVISPSEYIAEKLRSIGVDRIKVINNGINLTHFLTSINKEEARRRLGIPEDSEIVLYLGRIGREKDLESMIDSFTYLKRRGVRMIIAGGGPHLDFYKQYALSRGINGIEFPGFVSEEQKILYYRSADLFCNPSDYEVQSTVDVEAMASGTPILVPDNSSQVELVKPGISGEIFSLGNPRSLAERAIEMLDNIDRYTPKKIASNFSVEHHVDRLIEAYRSGAGA